MVCYDGMKQMIYRTTFALDNGTVERLKHLSGAWHVSQAEVVRRAISLADEKAKAETDAAAALRTLHKSGKLLVREQAEEYLAEVHENRRSWRGDG
jgi:Arc/MetJ-type ribon-helix-helix transcriptional regulator